MSNAENIGRRVHLLRKEPGLCRERMAEDPSVYQADIFNLERAAGDRSRRHRGPAGLPGAARSGG